MSKEAIIAIAIGFLLGLVITFGVYTANRSIKEKENSPASTKASDSPLSSAAPEAILEIESPENESLVEQSEITIRGQSDPQAIIAIFTEENEHLLTTNNEGTFSAQIKLIKGVNNIKVTAVNKTNQKVERNLTIVYSTITID